MIVHLLLLLCSYSVNNGWWWGRGRWVRAWTSHPAAMSLLLSREILQFWEEMQVPTRERWHQNYHEASPVRCPISKHRAQRWNSSHWLFQGRPSSWSPSLSLLHLRSLHHGRPMSLLASRTVTSSGWADWSWQIHKTCAEDGSGTSAQHLPGGQIVRDDRGCCQTAARHRDQTVEEALSQRPADHSRTKRWQAYLLQSTCRGYRSRLGTVRLFLLLKSSRFNSGTWKVWMSINSSKPEISL